MQAKRRQSAQRRNSKAVCLACSCLPLASAVELRALEFVLPAVLVVDELVRAGVDRRCALGAITEARVVRLDAQNLMGHGQLLQ